MKIDTVYELIKKKKQREEEKNEQTKRRDKMQTFDLFDDIFDEWAKPIKYRTKRIGPRKRETLYVCSCVLNAYSN